MRTADVGFLNVSHYGARPAASDQQKWDDCPRAKLASPATLAGPQPTLRLGNDAATQDAALSSTYFYQFSSK